MEGLKPPAALNFDGNLSENWKKWKQRYNIFAVATGSDKKDAEVQVAIFLHVIGEEALEKYNTFDLKEDEKKDVKKIIEAFEKYCTPKSNESVDRHIFFTRQQQTGESFTDFLTALKKLSSTCGFGDLRDSLIRDRIISGIADKNLKDRLLREEKLTLDKCVNMCKTSVLADVQLKTLSEENKIESVKLKQVRDYRPVKKDSNNERKNWNSQSKNWRNETAPRNKFSRPCGRCGNICRSPMAEAIFAHCVEEKGLRNRWKIDSAATADYHTGKNPDRRARSCLEKHSIPVSHKARPVIAEDFKTFDVIFGMDEENIKNLKRMAPRNSSAKIELLGDYDPEGPCIIRDPYYDDDEVGFEEVYQQCLRSCKSFLNKNS